MNAVDFPGPPQNKNGWPWIAENVEPSPFSIDQPWPKITVITPSYNQGRFLEETIRSVLLQGYPNLEYFVIDGGSSDYSADIIKRYETWITYWVSEPDRGQAHALNKGFERCTGDLVGWINSDDLLLPGSLEKLAAAYRRNPTAILLGDVINFTDGSGKIKTIRQKNISFESIVQLPISKAVWHQPGTYIPTKLLTPENKFLDETLRYIFDLDWMCRLLRSAGPLYLSEPVAKFRLHSDSKTVGENILWLPEFEMVIRRYWDEVPGLNKKKLLAYFEMFQAGVSLGFKRWDRKKGIVHLHKAFDLNPRIVISLPFLDFCLRSLLPRSFLLWVRKVHKK